MLTLGRSLLVGAVLAGLASGHAGAGGISTNPGEYPAESKALISATSAFFESIEARTGPRKRLPTIGIPLSATKSRAKSKTQEADVLTRMGPVNHLTGYRITWYPMDDLHGTVDFMGTWGGNGNLVCGYLSWNLADPGAPELETVTASFVDLSALRSATETQVHSTLIEANCAFGAIDANHQFFDVSG